MKGRLAKAQAEAPPQARAEAAHHGAQSRLILAHANAFARGDYDAAAEILAQLRRQTSTPKNLRPLEASEIFAELPPLCWTVEHLEIAPGAPTMLAGYGYSGKTVAAQAMTLAVAAGLPVWGEFAATTGPVLYLDFEQGGRLTRERFQRLARPLGILPASLEGKLSMLSYPGVYLDDGDAEESFGQLCAGRLLVVVDSLRAAAPTIDENASSARRVLDMLARISERTGCSFVVIHHACKPRGDSAGGARATVRGSGALYDALQSCLVFEGEEGKPPRVHHVKARISGQLARDVALEISDVEIGGDPRGGLSVAVIGIDKVEHDAAQRRQAGLDGRVIDFIKRNPGCSTREVREGVRGKAAAIDAALDRLSRNGVLVNDGTKLQAKWRVK